MWRELFNAPWPDEGSILPLEVQQQASRRIYDYWRSRGWQLVIGEVILWIAACSWDVPHAGVYGLLAVLIGLMFVLGVLPSSFAMLWLIGSVGLLMVQGMLVRGLGAVTALSYLVPYTFSGMLLSGRRRIIVQAWCVVAFWFSLIYEIVSRFPQLDPPRYILVSYNILLAAFTFQTLRFLNQLAVEINTVYVAQKVRQQSHQFLARVSHDLRTPLNSVLGFAKMLRRSELDETQSTYLHHVIEEGELLNRLVSDLLDSAHLSSGKLTLKLEPCDINTICEAVAEEHRPHIPPSVSLNVKLAPGLPPVNGDQDRLRQALGNLMANAVKHTAQGHITIVSRQQGTAVIVDVIDTGPGIPEDQQELIFVPFVQVDGRSPGVGLGLDIARQLALLHGGEIHLTSETGQGSAFSLELPSVTPVA
ncbi:MAG: HAMP domain-containing histidine kinase [Anaerolineae bacterium]|nr:HAMP domain-containing histidine kinase [Anaerolineae bacterium]